MGLHRIGRNWSNLAAAATYWTTKTPGHMLTSMCLVLCAKPHASPTSRCNHALNKREFIQGTTVHCFSKELLSSLQGLMGRYKLLWTLSLCLGTWSICPLCKGQQKRKVLLNPCVLFLRRENQAAYSTHCLHSLEKPSKYLLNNESWLDTRGMWSTTKDRVQVLFPPEPKYKAQK